MDLHDALPASRESCYIGVDAQCDKLAWSVFIFGDRDYTDFFITRWVEGNLQANTNSILTAESTEHRLVTYSTETQAHS